MFLTKDINILSSPNFLQPNHKRNNADCYSRNERKPILKKNSLHKNTNQIEGQSQKQNNFHLSKVSMSDLNQSGSNISSEYMRRIQKKKKSIFLELDEMKNSCRKRACGNSKKISFQSFLRNQSSILNNQQNSKQSKVNIVFSNSNIEDSFWSESKNEIDFELPQKSNNNLKNSGQKSLKDLKSSEVIQDKLPQPTLIKLEFKKAHLYEVKKSDKIIEDSDTKSNHQSENVRTFDKTFYQKKTPSSTAESNFFKKTQDDQDLSYKNGEKQFFTIKQTPPPGDRILGKYEQKIYKTRLANSQSEMKLGTINQSFLYRNRIEDTRKRLMESLKQSTYQDTENLLVTLNPTSSTILPEIDSRFQIRLEDDFKEDFFEKINVYRFLNRLIYKVTKFLDFSVNKRALEELVAQMIKVKCFTLLNSELELQTMHSFQNRSENDIDTFLRIIQVYIEKERQQSHWRYVETEFLRLTNSPLQLDSKILKFLQQTIPEMQKYLVSVQPQLQKNIKTKQTLLAQLRIQLLKHLLYDAMILNVTKHNQLPASLKTVSKIKQRLVEIIQKEKWLEKISFSTLFRQFQQLKVDFRFLSC